MTDREIKLELAKVALGNDVSIETAKLFYDWIIEEREREVPGCKQTKWDNTPIEDLACRTRIVGTITKRCKDNGINTVGELIRCGGHKFRTFKNVGGATITKINDALEKYYEVADWYMS